MQHFTMRQKPLSIVNVKEGLDIKNKFTVFEDKVVVSLPNGYFKCDIDDIDIVENHLRSSNRKAYITARINGKMILWHLSFVSATIKKASNTEIQQHLILEYHFALHMF